MSSSGLNHRGIPETAANDPAAAVADPFLSLATAIDNAKRRRIRHAPAPVTIVAVPATTAVSSSLCCLLYFERRQTLNVALNMKKHIENSDWTDCVWPMKLKNIEAFEQKNNISINIYGWEELTKDEPEDEEHFDEWRTQMKEELEIKKFPRNTELQRYKTEGNSVLLENAGSHPYPIRISNLKAERHVDLEGTRREDTARQRLYRQNQVEIEVYKEEIGALAAREDEQRRILKELWSQKAALQAKDEKYTQVVWEVRKHVLEHKDELEKLEKRKADAERQLCFSMTA